MTLASQVTAAGELPLDPTPFLPLVERQARRLARRLPAHIELGDLIGAGVLGLMEALRRYNPARSVAFHSYASFRIRGSMLDELRRRDLMARDARRETKQIERALQSLHLQLGRSPETAELAAALGMAPEALETKLAKMPHVSVTSLDDQHSVEPVDAEPSAFEQTARRQLHRKLASALVQISERSQKVLSLYYVESLTLKQIGQVLSISESRVSQIMSRATLELRALLEAQERTMTL